MKNRIAGLCILFSIGTLLLFLGFSTKPKSEPHTYYQVYLDDQLLGMIRSKSELDSYIDQQGNQIKKKYDVEKVYAPNGLEIKKIVTYNKNIVSAEKVYQMISKIKPFTIKGYQFKIKNKDQKKTEVIYTNKKSILQDAVENTIKTFVGKTDYDAYINMKQSKIQGVGTYINNIYVQNDLTIQEVRISTTEKIYTDATTLSQYLLFGSENQKFSYMVQVGDTIEQVAYNNKISPEEFFISNPEFTSRTNLLFPGQTVIIGMTNPKLKVVVEKEEVLDVANNYKTEERYDSEKLMGEDEVIQVGENGLDRITRTVTVINGDSLAVEIKQKEELKPSITQIIVKGEKVIPTVGSGTWVWPLNTHNYLRGIEYWINPDTGSREPHTGIDYGDRCGQPIYAANNGVVHQATSYYPNGNFVSINHNNGYYTVYAHMTRFVVSKGQTVAKGQIIGYVGKTGQAYGCHLHFEAWINGRPWRGKAIDARTLY